MEASRSFIHGGGLLVASFESWEHLTVSDLKREVVRGAGDSLSVATSDPMRDRNRLSPDSFGLPESLLLIPRNEAAHQSVQQISSHPAPFRFKHRDPVCLAGRRDQIPPHAHPWFEP